MPPATPRTLLCAQSLCLIVLLLQGVCKNREDKAEIPCNSCPRTFPTRRHLQEHRRAKHRDEREEALPTAPQNMGHSVGQYFSSVARVPAPRPQLPVQRDRKQNKLHDNVIVIWLTHDLLSNWCPLVVISEHLLAFEYEEYEFKKFSL